MGRALPCRASRGLPMGLTGSVPVLKELGLSVESGLSGVEKK